MNQIQVFISGLILLLPGAVDSYVEVKGVVGHPVTLPCTYSTYRGITTTCWGRGQCPSSACQNTLIWTNGHRVTYQKSSRYNLKGHISEGDVSLTIENSVESDSGLYCCRVEIPGWFNDQKVTFSLQVKPEIPTRPPRRPTTTRPTATGRPTTISTRSTHVPTSTRVSTSTPPTSTHTWTHKPEPTTFCPHETTAEVTGIPSHTPTDWNGTVTSSGDTWSNHTEAIPPGKPQKNPTKGFYVGICIAALLLLLLVSTVAITRYILMKRKSASLSVVAFRVSKIEALQNAAVVHSRAEDNIYIVEDRP
ncbi:hepatitis A virus cellular receptor 1 homolog isoform X2 [Mus musculus]|uniref:Hepatitis A virus cellular receptor 1 n=1 Tax=Mus musculus TaxID=10090 RepID=A0A0A0MQ86_MOUSE|nr:hepatitis A virus cellular receptor 1 homolog isoform a precursor [Mus musculus]XP_006532456.1 hepatitis A virus cellular receptor 1 homolog isoform X2 [Mus musculus]XP_030101483.1 hepatitis A virus cellular receptor 1 homolog isoform X2 [Mus musculus]EDL33800.1 hepatitis A virus cellular receptor 1, isoform CRA_a [Mus musculus]|eukprot:NP_599009.2 hepatitis A virus cellular receptor 1 homolog isoform a precursor [Mus musculus]